MLIQRSHSGMAAEGDRLLSDTEAAPSQQQQEQQQQQQQGAHASPSWSVLQRTLVSLLPPQALESAQRGASAVAATAGELVRPGSSLSPRSLKLLLVVQMAAVALLALALLLVQWQLSALHAATIPPEGQVRVSVYLGWAPVTPATWLQVAGPACQWSEAGMRGHAQILSMKP